MAWQVRPRIYDQKGSLPDAGNTQLRREFSTVNALFQEGLDSRDLKPLWREGHVEDHGTIPDRYRNIRHGRARDMFIDNGVLSPNPRWNRKYDKHIEDKLSFRESRLNPAQLPPAGKVDDHVSIGTALNPRIAPRDVEENHQRGHDLYVRTHQDYHPGEQVDRHYNWYGKGGSDKVNRTNGYTTGQRLDGSRVKRRMTWDREMPGAVNNLITSSSSRYNRFAKTFQSEVGKVRDPNEATRHLDPDHTFGVKEVPQGYGMFEALYDRYSNDHSYEDVKEQGRIASVRLHVKRANHQKFEHLQDAFDNFDRDGKGYLTAEDVREGCWSLKIPLDDKLLFALMRYCWLEEDQNPNEFNFETATLDMAKFIKHLTFEDHHEEACHFDSQRLTTSSEIGAEAGSLEASRAVNRHGLLSLHSVKHRRMNQQWEEDAHFNECLRPDTFANCGIYERDLMELRSENEMARLFVDFGPRIGQKAFDEAWPLAVKCSVADNKNNVASVQAFKMVLTKLSKVFFDEILP